MHAMTASSSWEQLLYLYGGDQPWDSLLWVTSDDRVRGGASKSHLFVVNPERARFYGHLDTKTLGGAGFASQHSLGVLDWDLSAYDGIVVSVAQADEKRYALTLKDEIPPRRDDGRQEAGISWEAVFKVPQEGSQYDMKKVYLPWSAFKPTYRGRPKPDAKPLDLAHIKRVGLMMRSFFDEQDGDFSIDFHAIAAWREISDGRPVEAAEQGDEEDDDPKAAVEAAAVKKVQTRRRVWLRRLLCGLI
ncbi:complex I intermediate-associated protein 30 domain-containing protein [Trichoderma aethiopicum]